MNYQIDLIKSQEYAKMVVKGKIENNEQSYQLHKDIVNNLTLIMGYKKLLIDLRDLEGRYWLLHLLERADKVLSHVTRIRSAILEDERNRNNPFFKALQLNERYPCIQCFFDSDKAHCWLSQC